jgi:hypothetical protein
VGVEMKKSLELKLRVWWDTKAQYIKIAGEGLSASTVSNNPQSKRYHPNLFRKLGKALEQAGLPCPERVSDLAVKG